MQKQIYTETALTYCVWIYTAAASDGQSLVSFDVSSHEICMRILNSCGSFMSFVYELPCLHLCWIRNMAAHNTALPERHPAIAQFVTS